MTKGRTDCTSPALAAAMHLSYACRRDAAVARLLLTVCGEIVTSHGSHEMYRASTIRREKKGGTGVPPFQWSHRSRLLDQASVLVDEGANVVRLHRTRGACQRAVVERLRGEADDRQ